MDRVAGALGAVVNARVATVRSLAFALAQEELARSGRRVLDDAGTDFLLEDLWASLPPPARAYYRDLAPTPAFFARLRETLFDLRLAAVDAAALPSGALEVEAKREGFVALARAFDERLARGDVIDYAGVLALALARLRREPFPLAAHAVAVRPADLELKALEDRLLAALGPGRVVTLPVDDERAAPAAGGHVFRAFGEANEVREVLRRCLSAGVPWDNVEVVYTDGAAYVPLLYEEMARLYPPPAAGGDGEEKPPVTLFEGIPARYSRPGRALRGAGWRGTGGLVGPSPEGDAGAPE